MRANVLIQTRLGKCSYQITFISLHFQISENLILTRIQINQVKSEAVVIFTSGGILIIDLI